uniref:protein SPIRAL1-like 1 n=1 Tax=Erigeron canadensis TaxID=72917 RepID=UPI001CB9A4E3|nr:protein SPIRAL1-like 1 [Erigeron canadensis]
MGRGVSSGGGQSSLNYLFGSAGEPKPATVATGNAEAQALAAPSQVNVAAVSEPTPKPVAAVTPPDITKQVPAGIQSSKLNNYVRADGQNTGNFLTDRPSTKVHAAPGGGSSLGYLFGDGST